MPIARRELLGLGAAVAISAVTASCRTPVREHARPEWPPSTASPARPRSRTFDGEPAPGHLYYGASLPAYRSLPAWERTLGSPLALYRSYFTPDGNELLQLVRQCRDDLAHDRLPHVSVKPSGTWHDVASGAQDDWLTTLLGALGRENASVFLTVHHEPENDAGPPGMLAADYVAMQHRTIRMASELAPKVTVVPVLQSWTFDPLRDDVDPSVWMVSDASVIGIDVYNPWSPTNGLAWRTFGSKVDEATVWLKDTPLAIGEYGCREDPSNPGMAADWLRDAAEYARGHNIVSMSYFNSGQNSPDGSWVLGGERERAFAELLGSDWVTRPT